LRSNTKGYGDKTHWTDSQNSNKTAPSGRELYHLQFLLQVASLETFGYTLVCPAYCYFLGFTTITVIIDDLYSISTCPHLLGPNIFLIIVVFTHFHFMFSLKVRENVSQPY